MKKSFVVALAVCLAVLMAVPAMATDVSMSGAYRIEGWTVGSATARDTDATDSYMDMRFRLNTVFKVDDTLDFTARFDALDGFKFGGHTEAGHPTVASDPDDGTNWDRAFITYRTELGTFVLGRQTGGAWGNQIFDYEGDSDRIKWVSPAFGNWKFVAIFQKVGENDSGTAAVRPTLSTPAARGASGLLVSASGSRAIAYNATDTRDADAYIGAVLYGTENWKTGLLYVYYDLQNARNASTRVHRFNPYFAGNWGPLTFLAELDYWTGETEYDTGAPDLDRDLIAWNAEVGYDFGPFKGEIGYVFFAGDNNANDSEVNNYNNGVGTDWEKLLILASDENPTIKDNLGGMGNFSRNENTGAGANIYYLGASFSPWENITLGAVIGTADADEQPLGWDDEYGTEYDGIFKWQIHPNLSYTAIAAFLDTGDFWKRGVANVAAFDDVFELYHKIQITF